MIWSAFLNRWCLSRGNCVALPGIFARAIPKMLQLCSRFDWKIWKPQPYVYYIYYIYIHMIYFIMLSTMVLCIYFLKSKIPKIIYRVQFSMAASWTQTPRCSPGVCRPWRQASKKLMLHMIPATKLGPEGRLTSSARQRSWLNFWNAQMFMTKTDLWYKISTSSRYQFWKTHGWKLNYVTWFSQNARFISMAEDRMKKATFTWPPQKLLIVNWEEPWSSPITFLLIFITDWLRCSKALAVENKIRTARCQTMMNS